MYPDKVINHISLEIYCCNEISECAINSFDLNVIDDDPEIDSSWIPEKFIVSLDDEIGESFKWIFNK